jgi:hypothetical protein
MHGEGWPPSGRSFLTERIPVDLERSSGAPTALTALVDPLRHSLSVAGTWDPTWYLFSSAHNRTNNIVTMHSLPWPKWGLKVRRAV